MAVEDIVVGRDPEDLKKYGKKDEEQFKPGIRFLPGKKAPKSG